MSGFILTWVASYWTHTVTPVILVKWVINQRVIKQVKYNF